MRRKTPAQAKLGRGTLEGKRMGVVLRRLPFKLFPTIG